MTNERAPAHDGRWETPQESTFLLSNLRAYRITATKSAQKFARGEKDVPESWLSVGNIDDDLANDIVKSIQKKCQKSYEKNTLLLIEAPPISNFSGEF